MIDCPLAQFPAQSTPLTGLYAFTLYGRTANDDSDAGTAASILITFYNTEYGWSSEEVFFSGAATGAAMPTPVCIGTTPARRTSTTIGRRRQRWGSGLVAVRLGPNRQ